MELKRNVIVVFMTETLTPLMIAESSGLGSKRLFRKGI
jgi:hypothetical protein